MSFLLWDSGNLGTQNRNMPQPQDPGNPGTQYFDMPRALGSLKIWMSQESPWTIHQHNFILSIMQGKLTDDELRRIKVWLHYAYTMRKLGRVRPILRFLRSLRNVQLIGNTRTEPH